MRPRPDVNGSRELTENAVASVGDAAKASGCGVG